MDRKAGLSILHWNHSFIHFSLKSTPFFILSFLSIHLPIYSYIYVGSLTPVFVLLPPSSWKFLLGIYYVLRVVLRVLGQKGSLAQRALLPPVVTDPSAITQIQGQSSGSGC